MSNFKPKLKTARSVKDILTSPEFLAQRQKSARYVKHEFQDYAYRLASDLGDINHKAIYMGLAKRENRMMLEQAAAFAMGYFKEINKGKIFMWKLQQLKIEAQRREDVKNFDHEFVLSKTGKLQTELIDVFAAKQNSLFNADREKMLSDFAQYVFTAHGTKRGQPKIWQLGSGIGLDIRYFSTLGIKVNAIELSPIMVKRSKAIVPDAAITRNLTPLKNSFKAASFNGVWCKIWPLITLDKDIDYLKEFARVLPKDGVLVLEAEIADAEAQSWQEFEWQKDIFIRFEKTNSDSELITKLSAAGFNLISKHNVGKSSWLYTAMVN